jgi:hypothetical protein
MICSLSLSLISFRRSPLDLVGQLAEANHALVPAFLVILRENERRRRLSDRRSRRVAQGERAQAKALEQSSGEKQAGRNAEPREGRIPAGDADGGDAADQLDASRHEGLTGRRHHPRVGDVTLSRRRDVLDDELRIAGPDKRKLSRLGFDLADAHK